MDVQESDAKVMNTIYIEVDAQAQANNAVVICMHQGNGMVWWLQRLNNPSVKRVLKVINSMYDNATYMGYADIVINLQWTINGRGAK